MASSIPEINTVLRTFIGVGRQARKTLHKNNWDWKPELSTFIGIQHSLVKFASQMG